MTYHLSDDTISIYERPVNNSGFVGGKYLDRSRVARPNGSPEAPTYYGPQDFYLGAVIDIYRRRFVVVDADYYVLKYMEDHAHQFPGSVLPCYTNCKSQFDFHMILMERVDKIVAE